MSFVPESVKQQLELCKGTGILDFGKTGLTEIPEQVGKQAAIERHISHVDQHEFLHSIRMIAAIFTDHGKMAIGVCD
jgi:hypothetical protein